MKSTQIASVSKLVVNALRGLKKSQGSSVKSIRTFIAKNYNVKKKDVTDKIPLALRKGVACGVIKKNLNNYKLDAIMSMVVIPPSKDIVETRRRRSRSSSGGRRRRRSHRRRGSRRGSRSRSRRRRRV